MTEQGTATIDEIVNAEPCTACNSWRHDYCVNKSGKPQKSYVHSVRRNTYLDHLAQGFPTEVSDGGGHQVPQITESPSVAVDAGQNWTKRYEMVRGVFRLMVKLDGHEATLDYLARLTVEMDVDLMILDEAKKL